MTGATGRPPRAQAGAPRLAGVWSVGAAACLAWAGCAAGVADDPAAANEGARAGGAVQARAAPSAWPARFGLGEPADPSLVAAWDVDVGPDGEGLPPGGATAAEGEPVYRAKCAACHGATGSEPSTGPVLVGREPREGFPFGADPSVRSTIGNYWPWATTVFDYVRRAMPLDRPGSLTDREVYAVTAYLLWRNELVGRDEVVDAASLPEVVMPARDRFVPDDRTGGPGFR